MTKFENMGDNSLWRPFLDTCEPVISNTAHNLAKPFFAVAGKFNDVTPNCFLFFCGFSFVLIPTIIAYCSIIFAVICVESCIILTFTLFLSLLFVLIGIWPALIISLGLTIITIIRLPFSIYYHTLVTYRTVMIRRNLKLLLFILLPVIHLLSPPFTLVSCLLIQIPCFATVAIAGFPIYPWKKIRSFHEKFWKKYVSDLELFAKNFGHSSGIPQDWDGTIYDLPVDPITIVIRFLVYIISAVLVSIGVFFVFFIKAIPIFLETLAQFRKTLNLRFFSLPEQATNPSSSQHSQQSTSGHAVWAKLVKKVIKGEEKFTEGYCSIEFWAVYCETIRNHVERVKYLHPKKLLKLLTNYMAETPLCHVFVYDFDCLAWIILWIPFLMTAIVWTVGLTFVLIIPPLTFLFGLIIWTACCIPVFVLPPVFYLAGWIFIIYIFLALHCILWVLILTGPWLFVVLGSVTGPFLSLLIPFKLRHSSNFYNPVEGVMLGLSMIPDILKTVDKFTGNLSVCKFRFCESDSNLWIGEVKKNKRQKINYYDLFINRCKAEVQNIRSQGLIADDDIQAASSTSMIAIPGVCIIAVLTDSVTKDKKNKTLIFWNEENQCTNSNRYMTDNVANHFWPELIKVKEGLMNLKDLDRASKWIIASLCNGEDSKSEQLSNALMDMCTEDGEHKKCLRIRASVENIVHALLRVQMLSSRLPEIFDI